MRTGKESNGSYDSSSLSITEALIRNSDSNDSHDSHMILFFVIIISVIINTGSITEFTPNAETFFCSSLLLVSASFRLGIPPAFLFSVPLSVHFFPHRL